MESTARFSQSLGHFSLAFAAMILCHAGAVYGQKPESAVVRTYDENAWYWQIDEQPTMLLGANETDHTFLMEDPRAISGSCRKPAVT